MNIPEFVQAILPLLGGVENISSVMHCFTRLRFSLRDETRIDEDGVKRLDGVLAVKMIGASYSVVVGNDMVTPVYEELIQYVPAEQIDGQDASMPASPVASAPRRNPFRAFFGLMGAVLSPIVPYLCACGVIGGVRALLNTLGWIVAGQTADLFLEMLFCAGYCFIPFYIAYAAAKHFSCNRIAALLVAGILMYPSWSGMSAAAAGRTVGMEWLMMRDYSFSVFPTLISVWLISVLEKRLDRVVRESAKVVAVPLISVALAGAAALVVAGPLCDEAVKLILKGYLRLYAAAPCAASAAFAVSYPFQVLAGSHTIWSPLSIASIQRIGVDYLLPGICIANTALSGAALGAAVRSRNARFKRIAGAAALNAAIGLTEPALFGVFLPLKKMMLTTSLSIAAGAVLYGIYKVSVLGVGLMPLGSFPVFMTDTFVPWAIITAATFSLSLALAVTVGYRAGDETGLPGYDKQEEN